MHEVPPGQAARRAVVAADVAGCLAVRLCAVAIAVNHAQRPVALPGPHRGSLLTESYRAATGRGSATGHRGPGVRTYGVKVIWRCRSTFLDRAIAMTPACRSTPCGARWVPTSSRASEIQSQDHADPLPSRRLPAGSFPGECGAVPKRRRILARWAVAHRHHQCRSRPRPALGALCFLATRAGSRSGCCSRPNCSI